jgi:diaminobutyrate-2-oxoglutarate transaminase
MTLGSLALTGNGAKRAGGGVELPGVTRAPFCGYMGEADTAEYLEKLLQDSSSGVDQPAAIILETIQAEGGINEATANWLKRIQHIARKQGALFIVDDIQVGCGRTGTFFSFEAAGLSPDIVCLSKSLSGFGLPFALTLFKRELDAWAPGEHNGTFRGNNLAFVTAEKALREFWSDDVLSSEVTAKGKIVRQRLDEFADRFGGERRGRGLIQGVQFTNPKLAGAASAAGFRRGLIIETSGPHDEVLKVLPPLTISEAQLNAGLDIVEESLAEATKAHSARLAPERRIEA